jgi:hypothetical protein
LAKVVRERSAYALLNTEVLLWQRLMARGLRGQAWIDQIFTAAAARNGDVVRRKISSVNQFANEAMLVADVRRRRWHIVVSSDQHVILCNPGDFNLVC